MVWHEHSDRYTTNENSCYHIKFRKRDFFFSFKLILRSRWRRCVWDQGGGEGEGDGVAKRARTGQTNTFYSLSVYWHGPVTHGTSLTRRH